MYVATDNVVLLGRMYVAMGNVVLLRLTHAPQKDVVLAKAFARAFAVNKRAAIKFAVLRIKSVFPISRLAIRNVAHPSETQDKETAAQ